MKRLRLIMLMFSIALAGCSLPKIVVLHDPLSAEEHVKLGSIYASQGKVALARDQYQAAVKQDPKNARAWSLLGDTGYALKDYTGAERAYDSALKLDPKSGDLHNNLAWVYVQQDRKLSKAQDLVMAAMDLNHDHRPYYLDTLGVIQLKLGKIPDAIASLRGSTETIPPDRPEFLAEAYRHLADAYQAAGDEAAANETLQRAGELRKIP